MKDKNISNLKNYTIVQANDLIRNKKDFSLWELRVFALLAANVKKEDEDFQTYKFRIRDIMELFEAKSHNLNEELREIPERLHAKLIKIPYIDKKGKKRMRRYNLVSMSDFSDEESVDEDEYILLRFDKDLKSLMLSLGEHFTVYQFYNILKLRSPYIFQLYELLKSEEYKSVNSIILKLEELREILQIPPSYKYGNIRQRILEPAQKQFKAHTDITFSYRTIKDQRKGGRVDSIQFFIYKNNRVDIPESLEDLKSTEEKTLFDEHPIEKTSNSFLQSMLEQLKDYMSPDAIGRMVKAYPESQINRAIKLTFARLNKGAKIKNIAGHIIALAKEPELFDQVLPLAKEKVLYKKPPKVEESAFEKERKELYKEYNKKESAIIKDILGKDTSIKLKIINIVKNQRFSSFNPSIQLDKNLENPLFLAAFKNQLKKQYPSYFVELEQWFTPLKIALERKK